MEVNTVVHGGTISNSAGKDFIPNTTDGMAPKE
jgi:hypothetical protein